MRIEVVIAQRNPAEIADGAKEVNCSAEFRPSLIRTALIGDGSDRRRIAVPGMHYGLFRFAFFIG